MASNNKGPFKNQFDSIVTTTVEIAEPSSSHGLKKIATSSTLNSYGKSSSIQSKLTNTTNNSSSRKKLNLSASSTRGGGGGNGLSTKIGEPLNTFNSLTTAFDTATNNTTNTTTRLKSGNQMTRQLNQQPQQKVPTLLLTRQSTTMSLNNENTRSKSPLQQQQQQQATPTITNRKNSTSTIANQIQPLRPTPRPRTNTHDSSRRTSSLQRQVNNNTNNNNNSNASFVPVTTNIENSAFITMNTRRDSMINNKSSSSNKPTNEIVRPKTSFTSRQVVQNQNTTAAATSNTNKLLLNHSQHATNAAATNNATQAGLKLKTSETNTSRTNLLLLPNEDELGISLSHFPTETNGLNEFTLMRIIKWLQDIENCTNMMKPPAQLTWSNRTENMSSSRQRGDQQQHHHHSTNLHHPQNELNGNGKSLNNEYCLSDYDSLDDQIIEYNRVVDKTFHIVHDD